MTARLLAIALAVAVLAALATIGQDSPPATAVGGGHPGAAADPGRQPRHLARRPGVAGMTQPVLERTARYVARHGGIRGSCYQCASAYMQRLSYELVGRAFPPGRKGWAICIVAHESGGNPGAVSPSGALGLSQILPTAHPEFDRWALVRDPVYQTRAFVRLSRIGTVRSPWDGQGYRC
jgi:hypothetical protein